MASQEDELLPLGADGYLQKLLKRKTLLDQIWSGFKFTCLFLSLFLSIYSIYLTQRAAELRDARSDIEMLKHKVSQDEEVESNQLKSLARLNQTLMKHLDETKGACFDVIVFDCYRTTRFSSPGILTYDGCFVDTTKGAMNRGTGIFTVQEGGIYQITFTAKYVSSNRGRFGAWSDIYVNHKVIADSQREYNGPDTGSFNNRRSSLSESSTHTILVIHVLQPGDQVKVQFNRDGTSYIHSDNDHDVHFTARKLAPIP